MFTENTHIFPLNISLSNHLIIFLYIPIRTNSRQGLLMKTIVNDMAFVIKFGYPVPAVNAEPGKHPALPKRRESLCYIRVGKNNDPEKQLGNHIITTKAKNHPKDHFSRAAGRYLTFKKAMNILFSEEMMAKYELVDSDRKTFEQDFAEQCPGTFRHLPKAIIDLG